MLAVIIASTIFAPLIATHGPLAQDQFHAGAGSSESTFSAPTSSVGTSSRDSSTELAARC